MIEVISALTMPRFRSLLTCERRLYAIQTRYMVHESTDTPTVPQTFDATIMIGEALATPIQEISLRYKLAPYVGITKKRKHCVWDWTEV